MLSSLSRPKTVNKTGYTRDLKALRDKARAEGNEARDKAFTECIIVLQNTGTHRSEIRSALKAKLAEDKSKGKDRKIAFLEALVLLRKY